jgi:hypothetical protein
MNRSGPFCSRGRGLLIPVLLLPALALLGCGRGGDRPGGPPSIAVSFDSLAAFSVPDPGAAVSPAGAAAGATVSTGPAAATAAGLARTTPAPPGTRPPGSSPFVPPPSLPALPADPESMIPPAVRALDGHEVTVRGYMIPVDFEVEGTNRFVLLRCTLACCYGKMPRVNDWIDVSVRDGRRVPYVADRLVAVRGRMKVKLSIEGENLIGLYWLEADGVEEAR